MNQETTYQAILGQALKELRKSKDYDQVDIAEKLGINRSSYSRIESGNTIVNIQQLQKIASIYKMEASEILLEVDRIVNNLQQQGWIIHYDSINNVKSKSEDGKALALIGGAALGLIVGAILFNNSKK